MSGESGQGRRARAVVTFIISSRSSYTSRQLLSARRIARASGVMLRTSARRRSSSAASSIHAFIPRRWPRIVRAAVARRSFVIAFPRAFGIMLRTIPRRRESSAAVSTHALRPKRSPRFAIAIAA